MKPLTHINETKKNAEVENVFCRGTKQELRNIKIISQMGETQKYFRTEAKIIGR